MRTWFYEHPNAGVCFFGLWFVFFAAVGVYRFDHEQWGWAILDLICAALSYHNAVKWWNKT